MKKIVILLLFVVSGCSFLVPHPGVQRSEQSKAVTALPSQTILPTKTQVVVGVLLPFDGKYSEVSNSILESIQLAYSSNLNKNIVIKVYNTNENGKDSSVKAATDAVTGGVDIILGPLLSTELTEITSITEPKNIPVIAFSNDRTAIVGTNNTYLMGFSPEEEIERIVDYVVTTKNAHNFAALIPENKYGEIVLADLQSALAIRGATLTKVVTYPPDEINFTPYVEKLIDQSDLDDYNKALETYNSSDHNKYRSLTSNDKDRPKPKLNFDTLFIGDFGKRLTLLGVHLPFVDIDTSQLNVIGTRLWANTPLYTENAFYNSLYPDLPTLENTIFASKYQSIYKKPATLITAIAYDSFQMIADLITVNKETGELQAHFSKQAITNYQGFGVLGSFDLRSDGLSAHDLIIKQILPNGINVLDQTSNYQYMKVQNYQAVTNSSLGTTENTTDNSSTAAQSNSDDDDDDDANVNNNDSADTTPNNNGSSDNTDSDYTNYDLSDAKPTSGLPALTSNSTKAP